MVATRDTLSSDGQTALGALSTFDGPMPQPRILLTPRDDVLTAYAPDITPDPGAQRALEILIQRETAAADALVPAEKPLIDTSDIRIASLGGTNGIDLAKNIFDMTWSAVTEAGGGAVANTLVSAAPPRESLVGLKPRDFDLIAPEIDHVNETLVEPVLMTDLRGYAGHRHLRPAAHCQRAEMSRERGGIRAQRAFGRAIGDRDKPEG